MCLLSSYACTGTHKGPNNKTSQSDFFIQVHILNLTKFQLSSLVINLLLTMLHWAWPNWKKKTSLLCRFLADQKRSNLLDKSRLFVLDEISSYVERGVACLIKFISPRVHWEWYMRGVSSSLVTYVEFSLSWAKWPIWLVLKWKWLLLSFTFYVDLPPTYILLFQLVSCERLRKAPRFNRKNWFTDTRFTFRNYYSELLVTIFTANISSIWSSRVLWASLRKRKQIMKR